jgi:acyl carrier protein
MVINDNTCPPKRPKEPVNSAALRQWLITNIAAVLEIDEAALEVDRNLDELGLDSLQSVCLAGDLEAWLGIEIPATAIWDYPTIDCLCEYLTKLSSAATASDQSIGEEPCVAY